MTLLRSVAITTALLTACGGSSKPSTMPAESVPAAPAPATDDATTPVEPATPAMAPDSATPAEAGPAAASPPPPAPRKTRAPVKKNADPCDGGE